MLTGGSRQRVYESSLYSFFNLLKYTFAFALIYGINIQLDTIIFVLLHVCLPKIQFKKIKIVKCSNPH